MSRWLAAAVLAMPFALPVAASAQQERPSGPEAQPDEIVVTAAFERDQRNSTSPVSVLSGAELDRELRPQLGDALARQPGVSNTSFGPNVSRPILRGLAGERVRVLTDGIGAFDVSNTSADHAVAIDPLLAERIEVLRGPASLRYGSSAIGGVVNVFDRRIPTAVPVDLVAVQARGSLGSAARERSAGANVTLRLAHNVAISGGGSLTETDDLRIGGAVLSDALRSQARASADPAIRALADLRGRVPNTAARTRTANLGAAIIDPGGTLGFSISHYESVYALPIRFDVASDEQDAVSIDAEQTRADLRAAVEIPDGFLERLSLRAGYADYQHIEREADGSAGTLFANKGYEARAELRQRARGGWQGLIGAQTFFRDFLAVGAEAFVPPNETEQNGVFALQEVAIGPVRFEAGGRIERTSIRSTAIGFDRSFTAGSIAAGVFATVARGLKIGVNLSSTARAPAAEELLADGPHIGTQSFEIGNPGFGIERARGIELVIRANGPGWRIDVGAYRTRFAGYIYEFETGEVREDLPVFQFEQGDARYEGFEIEGALDLTTWLKANVLVDAVRATIDGFGPAPRIPPLRVLGGVDARRGAIGARAEVEHTSAQRRVTGFETTTAGFTTANISIHWKPLVARDLRLTLSAANLFDVVGRRHASFLKDYAPLAGRDIRLSVNTRF